MDVAALCIQMWMSVFILLAVQDEHGFLAQKADAASLHISPERLQFFVYDSISIHCEDTDSNTGWKVVRKLQKKSPADSPEACNTTAPSCRIDPATLSDSGEYWCENEEGEKSNAVNVSVSAGSVILVIPTRPVMEGSDVTLHCLEKGNTADFYRDGCYLDTRYDDSKDSHPLKTQYGNSKKTINNVSRSDEGFYKCSISGSGESPESWLAVFTPDEASYEETSLPRNTPMILILRCTALLVMLLAVVMGRLLFRKLKVNKTRSEEEDNVIESTINNVQV